VDHVGLEPRLVGRGDADRRPQLHAIVDEVALRSGGRVTILGTNVATRKLAGIGLEFGDNLKEQIWETARDAGMLLYGVPKGRLGRVILT
jgi:hypothetical protein